MTDQDIPTIASVKQSMQRHIYDLSSSLAIARAATEGRLPEAYTDQGEAVNLMIRQAHVFSNKLVSELENMDALEGMERIQTQGAAVSDAAVNTEAANKIGEHICSARSILDLIATLDERKGTDSLLKNTLSSACLTVMDHIDAINDLARGSLKEAQS